jgi:hypothetical protein
MSGVCAYSHINMRARTHTDGGTGSASGKRARNTRTQPPTPRAAPAVAKRRGILSRLPLQATANAAAAAAAAADQAAADQAAGAAAASKAVVEVQTARRLEKARRLVPAAPVGQKNLSLSLSLCVLHTLCACVRVCVAVCVSNCGK